ncbi:MAG: polysaccharide biosynthesis C-terminal domain-containing protein [Spirochaetaceae bacterium]|nr:polysaccharide biosynthesis C-terminal domain-containing protein [Spirochaetaceae bacterium]
MKLVQESFSTRYAIKIISSILIALLNVVVQLLLPRTFSITEYGYYSYNLNVFTAIVTIFNLSASDALVSKFSKNNNDNGYVILYFCFLAVVSFILNVGTTIIYILDIVQDSFTGQTLYIILLGLNAAIVRKLLTDIVSIYDALAFSKIPAFWQIIQKILITVFVFIGYLMGILNLCVFYIFQILTILFVSIILLFMLFSHYKKKLNNVTKRYVIEYVKEYVTFCRPLVISTIIAQGIIILKNWALMKWSGVTSSAVFGVALQLNVIISYVFSPYAELLKREFAVIYHEKDVLYFKLQQSLKVMSWLVSFFCVFIAVNAHDILFFLFGEKYLSAAFVTQLIMVYTIYQSWGQVLGSFMLAIEKTKVYAMHSVFTNVISLILVYIFQIPNFIWEKGLGASGMAWSYTIGNVFSVTGLLFLVLKGCKVSFSHVVKGLIISILVCFGCSMLPYLLLNNFFDENNLIMLRILCSGLIYCVLIMFILIRNPELVGINLISIIKNRTR